MKNVLRPNVEGGLAVPGCGVARVSQELALLSIRTQFQQNQPKWRRLGVLWWHVTYGLTAAIATFAMNDQTTDILVSVVLGVILNYISPLP